MKNIWFVSHYSMPPELEQRNKTQMYAHYLNLMGYTTTIFSASTIHNSNINLITTNELYINKKYNDLDFIHIKCHNYAGNGLRRILNMFEFSKKFRKIANKMNPPEVVIADVNCINYFSIFRYCRENKIKFYIDMRDLWPMSIVEYYKYSERNPLIKYLYFREKNMYRNADGVIFSMPGGADYIKDKKWEKYLPTEKTHYINNGVDLNSFYNQIAHYCFNDSELDDTTFKVIYTGSIRVANNLKPLVEAGRKLLDRGYKDIRIMIYGEGDAKKGLEELCKTEAIDNVVFKGNVPKTEIPFVLSKSDLNVLIYKQSRTLQYGGSQNKLFEYMAIGKPILITVSMNYNFVKDANCGLCIDEPTPEKIANAIIECYNMPKVKRAEMGVRGKEFVKEFDFSKLTERLQSIIDLSTNQ